MNKAELTELEIAIEEMWSIAHSFGLDPYPVVFEVVPPAIMYEFGAYGLPTRFSHWTHGQAYHRMKTMYDYGLSQIYELVINTNPAQAFLVETNSLLQNKMVAAHVIGHSHTFSHNAYLRRVSHTMGESAALNAERIAGYEQQYGVEAVEQILDAALSIEHNINLNQLVKPDITDQLPQARETDYDDLFSLGLTQTKAKPSKKIPLHPDSDLLGFIAKHARYLEDWQRDILYCIHEEALYFLPQMQTKCLNEGVASFAHTRIMRELNLTDTEYSDFAKMNAGVLATSKRRVNPYTLGLKILEGIERNISHQAMLDVIETETDVSLLRNYLTKEVIEDLDMYTYAKKDDKWVIVEKDWEKVRDTLVNTYTNFGLPIIKVEDSDYEGRGELLLVHQHDGRDLERSYVERTLEMIKRLWQKPVSIRTIMNGTNTTFQSSTN